VASPLAEADLVVGLLRPRSITGGSNLYAASSRNVGRQANNQTTLDK
jgi:hypothetical protein